MNGMNYVNWTKADKCALLLAECECAYNQNFVVPEVVQFHEPTYASTIMNVANGISTMQLFPMSEPENVFHIVPYSASEALQRDWYVIGEDIWNVIIRELGNELTRLTSLEPCVHPTKRAKTESACIR